MDLPPGFLRAAYRQARSRDRALTVDQRPRTEDDPMRVREGFDRRHVVYYAPPPEEEEEKKKKKSKKT